MPNVLAHNQSETTLHMGYSKNYTKDTGINSSKAIDRYKSVDFVDNDFTDIDDLMKRIK